MRPCCRRSWPERVRASCVTTSFPPGSSWATPARSCSASPSRRCRSSAAQDRVHGRALPAAARACRADHRHLVRRREAAQVRAADLGRRSVASPPPIHEHRLRPATGGADDVGVDGGARRGCARDTVHPVPRRRPRGTRGRRSSWSRSHLQRWRSPSTSSTCSRSSSSATHGSGAGSPSGPRQTTLGASPPDSAAGRGAGRRRRSPR